eukprot:6182228-Pleurochrysis_carterae.AAC.1
MRVLGLGLAEYAISWSTGGSQRSNDELLDALGKVLKAEAQLRADSALIAEAATPRMKNKTFKQLGTPTVDAEELDEIEEIDLEKLLESATAARGADEARRGRPCSAMLCRTVSPVSRRRLTRGSLGAS